MRLLAVLTAALPLLAVDADLIVVNGRIRTLDPRQPLVEAIAVVGERIAEVGSNAAVLSVESPARRPAERCLAARSILDFGRPNPHGMDSHHRGDYAGDMDAAFESDSLDRLVCSLSQGESRATVTSSDKPAAARSLLQALEDLAQTGSGECFWQEAGGDYRWMLKRDHDTVNVVVLWSTGTLTGWEHLFWGQHPAESFCNELRRRLTAFA